MRRALCVLAMIGTWGGGEAGPAVRTAKSLAVTGVLQLGVVALLSLGQPLEQRRVRFGEYSVLLLLAQGLKDLKFEGCFAASA